MAPARRKLWLVNVSTVIHVCVSLLSSPSNSYVSPSSARISMDPDYVLPPPAYSEQEFDQKISQATILSLHTSQALTDIDSDGWPQYDPAAFETPFASEGSSSSPTTFQRSSPFPVGESLGKKDDNMEHGIINDLPSVVPLRIEKKKQQKPNLPKPPAISQPKNEGSSLVTDENPTPTLFYPTSDRDDFRSQPHSVQSICAEDDVSLTTALPVHSMRMTPIRYHERGTSLPSLPLPPLFEDQPPTCSLESSPLARPFSYHNHHQQYVDPSIYNVTPSQPPQQSLPIQSRPRVLPQERPMTSYPPSPNDFRSSYIPRLDFNPSIAYGKTQPVTPSTPLKPPIKNVQYDPHALYNSAVSAQLKPITTGQHGHLSYPSHNPPQNQYQQPGLPATYSRPGHYSQSFVSQDSLSSERSTSPFEINSSRQSVPQPPARPSSSYSMTSNYQTFNISPSPVYQHVNHTTNVPGNVYYGQQGAEDRWSAQ